MVQRSALQEREQKAFSGEFVPCEICGESVQVNQAYFYYNISVNTKVYVHADCRGPWEVVMELSSDQKASKWWSVPPGWENAV